MLKETVLYNENKNLKLILKVVGNCCNINCKYCFEKAKDVNNQFMTANQLSGLLERIEKPVTIIFHGGEPLLLGKKHMRELLNVVRQYYMTKIMEVRIQTNGTLFDDEWAELLFSQYRDLNIETAISLDGTYEMNNLRSDYFGDSTFNKVIDAYRVLEKRNKTAGMLSVIARHSLLCYAEYAELIKSINNLKFVKINALFNIKHNELTEDSITPTEFATYIINFAKVYIESGLYQKVAVEPILSMLQKVNGKPSRYCNYNQAKCFEFISVYPNDLLGPCDCFSAKDFTIENTGINLEQCIANTVLDEKTDLIKGLLNQCKSCEIFEFCTGGCLSQRFYFRNNDYLSRDFCESKKMLFKFASKFKL